MKEWFRLFFHHHKWKTLQINALNPDRGNYVIGKIILQECEVCGKIRQKTLKN